MSNPTDSKHIRPGDTVYIRTPENPRSDQQRAIVATVDSQGWGAHLLTTFGSGHFRALWTEMEKRGDGSENGYSLHHAIGEGDPLDNTVGALYPGGPLGSGGPLDPVDPLDPGGPLDSRDPLDPLGSRDPLVTDPLVTDPLVTDPLHGLSLYTLNGEDLHNGKMDKAAILKRVREQGFEGEPCPQCGAMKLIRNGTCLLCIECGSTSGCS